MPVFIDLIGRIFERLTVIKYIDKNKYGQSLWLCKCSCGNNKIIVGNSLLKGNTKSCGCLRKEGNNIKHNFSKTKIYRTWKHMLSRCTNPKDKRYQDYNGRNINICHRWSNKKNGFENFYNDVGDPPTKYHSIDRINNDKGYSPNNWRWATSKEQNRNSRHNHLLRYDNKELCLSEWAEITGIKEETIRQRLNYGWTIEDALMIPAKKYKKRGVTRAI
jgi:hypothetical protein